MAAVQDILPAPVAQEHAPVVCAGTAGDVPGDGVGPPVAVVRDTLNLVAGRRQ